jgi:hypothetical protein
MFHLKLTLTATYKHLNAQIGETNGSIELFQSYSVVAADALFEIGMAVIYTRLSLDGDLSQTNKQTNKHFLCSEILLPFCALLSYPILPCQDKHR